MKRIGAGKRGRNPFGDKKGTCFGGVKATDREGLCDKKEDRRKELIKLVATDWEVRCDKKGAFF